MHAIENIQTIAGKSIKPISQRHNQVIDKLELMLEKGITDHTMSELAAKLKVSLRTLYEIAPSKDHLIRLTVNRILIRLGKEAIATITDIKSPIDKLKKYLLHANQAVGPKFKVYLQNLNDNDKSKKMIDYHEDYITSFTKELLDEAIAQKEIKKIDTQALALLLGGIGRDFAKDSNVKKLSDTPEKSANSITEIILNGIKLEK